jgi:hypothetical protein
MDTSGFFRVDQDGVFMAAPNFVLAPTYELRRHLKDTYMYPTEGGWIWFDSEEDAKTYFNIQE